MSCPFFAIVRAAAAAEWSEKLTKESGTAESKFSKQTSVHCACGQFWRKAICDWHLNFALLTVWRPVQFGCFVPRGFQASFFSSLSSFFWMLSSLSFASFWSSTWLFPFATSNCALSLNWPVKEITMTHRCLRLQCPLYPPRERVKRCLYRPPQK